jgi:ABC-type transporter Mla MlaB component
MAASAPTTIALDASAVVPDAVSIDTLARLQLTMRREGRRLELRGVSDELRDLIAFAGLSDVLGVEPRGQAEQREEGLGVEEERELDDPTA